MTELKKPRAKKGTGTVFERPSGWYCQWSSRDPGTGARRIHKKGSFRTEREARKYLTAELAKVDAGTFIPAPRPVLIGEVLDAWIASKTRVKPTTLSAYRIAADRWVRPRVGGIKLAALTETHVNDMLASLATDGGRTGKPLSNRSRQLALVTLTQAINYGIRQGWVVKNVAAAIDGVPASTPKTAAWTAAEARTFLQAIRGDRLSALYTLAVTRGLRRGELAGLQWEQVDLEAGHLQIEHTIVLVDGKPQVSTPKTRASRRRVPLDAALLEVLRTHRKAQIADRLAAGTAWHDTGYVFTNEIGQPLNPDHISNRFEALVKAAKVRRIRVHDLRHTAATLMLADGQQPKVVSELIGHSNVGITLSIYGHVLPGMAEAAGASLTRMVL